MNKDVHCCRFYVLGLRSLLTCTFYHWSNHEVNKRHGWLLGFCCSWSISLELFPDYLRASICSIDSSRCLLKTFLFAQYWVIQRIISVLRRCAMQIYIYRMPITLHYRIQYIIITYNSCRICPAVLQCHFATHQLLITPGEGGISRQSLRAQAAASMPASRKYLYDIISC